MLFIVYEKSTNRYKYEGSGLLKEKFKNGEALTDGVPSVRRKKEKSGCSQVEVKKERGGEKELPINASTRHILFHLILQKMPRGYKSCYTDSSSFKWNACNWHHKQHHDWILYNFSK